MTNEYDKYSSESEDEFSIDEKKFGLRLRHETELFDDDSYVVHSIFNIRRVELPDGIEDWEFVSNKEVVFVLKGVRFTKKERTFLRTPSGMGFLLNGYKQGWKTIAEFKKHLKKQLSSRA